MRKFALSLFVGLLAYSVSYGQSFVAYSNVTTFSGSAFSNGGTSAGITRLVADDITVDPAFQGGGFWINQITFSVFNGNATALTIRPRLRFWLADGAANGSGVNDPGTQLAQAFSFNPLSVNANTVATFFFTLTPFQMMLPNGTFWAGITFDNVGATATNAQTDLFGQGIWGPPTVGSSVDTAFRTTATGSFFVQNNPAGAQFNFGGTPTANFGWVFNVTPIPEPTTIGLFGLMLVGAVPAYRRYRRRQLDSQLDEAEAKALYNGEGTK